MIKINKTFLFVFLLTNIPFLYAYFYNDPNGLVSVDFSLSEAIVLHVLCTVFFLAGYFFTFLVSRKSYVNRCYTLRGPVFVVLMSLSVLGVFTSIWQIQQTLPIMDYFSSMLTGQAGAEGRDAYLLDSRSGGLPGYIKIFNNAPLAVFLFACAAVNYLNLDQASMRQMKRLLFFSFFFVVFKTFLSLDRITILALMLCYFDYGARKGFTFKQVSVLFFLLVIANILSMSRMQGYSVFDFVFMYMKLGLINLQLLLQVDYDYTFGFQTIFHFLTYVWPGVNDSLGIEFQDYKWFWNPALYFASYGYLDFGYFVLLLYAFLGALSAFFDTGVKRNNSKVLISLYFVFLYAVASLFTVPVIRGVEFVLAVLLASFFAIFLVKKV
ncbi:hypothetical protein [Pseudomonas lundensis]|uniref:hypothetical protein n=1 Tax=Pseudomonas lundensis TaxID=86185 RepID=UPI000AB5BE64|nr:hypothetical protein [Pseudomonas lundensis]